MIQHFVLTCSMFYELNWSEMDLKRPKISNGR